MCCGRYNSFAHKSDYHSLCTHLSGNAFSVFGMGPEIITGLASLGHALSDVDSDESLVPSTTLPVTDDLDGLCLELGMTDDEGESSESSYSGSD